MGRIFAAFAVAFIWCSVGVAQPLTGLARVEVEGSYVRDGWFGGSEVSLRLSQGVPFRVFTLEGPPRLVLDFAEADFSAVEQDGVLKPTRRITGLRYGGFAPGWSRLVADLSGPMVPSDVAMRVDRASGAAHLELALRSVDAQTFAAQSGPPVGTEWEQRSFEEPKARAPKGGFVVVLDPGHGGIDPGAERDGLVEKVLALDFARNLRDILRREGVHVEMTRDADHFVSLEGRTAFAHQRGATVFVSIHADALPGGGAEGATVYTLSEEASDVASAQLAARHDRSDILAGTDLSGADDEVTSVLLDLVRRETEPRSAALAQEIINGMDAAGGPMNRKPWRKAGFSVLKSADIPSVLVEVGFLSSQRDRKNLADPIWRSVIAGGVADAILSWRDADAARAGLVRQ